MGNNVQYVNSVGRPVPKGVATAPFRKLVLKIAPALLALAPSQDTPKEPHYDPDLTADVAVDRIHAEKKAIEKAYGDVVLIPVEYADHTFIDDAEHKNHPEGVEVNEGNGYYAINVDRMYNTILAGFERAGQFNTDRQRANMAAYLPGGKIPEDIRLVNSVVARRMTENMIQRFSTDNLGVAFGMRFNRNELDPTSAPVNQQVTGCVVMLLPTHMDSDEYVRRFTSINQMNVVHEIDLADFNQFIANHEFTHCVMSKRQSMPTWFNESVADMYAAARHIQLNGDDGFVQLMRDVRNVSVISHRDFGHDTVPVLDRAIPRLLEAYENGELDGLDPKELLDKSLKLTFGHWTPGKEPQGFKEIADEVEARNAVFTEYGKLVNVDSHYIRTFDQNRLTHSDLPEHPEKRALMENILESHNESVVNLYMAADRVRRYDTRAAHRPEAENTREDELFAAMQRRRGVLQELADTQSSPQEAYNALGYEVKKLVDKETRLRKNLGDERAEQIMRRPDNTGLNFAQQVVLLTEFRMHYGAMPGVKQDDLQMPTIATPQPEPQQGGPELVS